MRVAGYYWVAVTEPVCDRGGVIDEVKAPPEVARFDGLRWYRTGMEGPVADQYGVEVLSPELLPMPREAAAIALLRFAVDASEELAPSEDHAHVGYVTWESGDLERAMSQIHASFERNIGRTLVIRRPR